MNDNQLPIQFGVNIDPAVQGSQQAFRRAQIADEADLDLVTVQDHPYNRHHLETWTLLTALAMKTEQVHLVTNVLSTPLRPPAMLAKMAATLDRLSHGRLELGLGAGAFVEGIRAYGGEIGATPGKRYQAFKESVEIIQGMWAGANGSFSYEGEIHTIKGARPGPAPTHPIPIWFGALGPRMLQLTGRLADGLLISRNYVPPKRLAEVNRLLDEGTEEAGRPATAVRRGYNLMGVLHLNQAGSQSVKVEAEMMAGPAASIMITVKIVTSFMDIYDVTDSYVTWNVQGDSRQHWFSAGGLTFYSSHNPRQIVL